MLKASEVVQRLQELIAKHGDLPVFSECDWDFVEYVGLSTEEGFKGQNQCFVME